MINKLRLLKRKFELAAMAVTYAEVGEWQTAEEYLEKIKSLNESKNPKIVVVALDSEFLPGTIEYTVNLAERLHSDVLAVNAIQHDHNKALFTRKKKFGRGKSKGIFSSLVESAQMRKIRCETIITMHDFRSQIRKLLKQIHQVEFVLIQTNRDQDFSINLGIPVFKIVPGSAHY